MYQFTTTTVINSALDSNGVTAKFAGTANDFTVTRVNKFKKAGITLLNKRAYQAGVKEVATIVMPSATAGEVIRLEVDVRLDRQTNSEYANAYLYFKKPVTVEVLYETSAIVTATKLVAALNGMKDRYGFAYITASNVAGSSATITITATDVNQRFYSVIISKEDTSPNSIIQPNYDVIAGGVASYLAAVNNLTITVSGKLGFGDDDWMARSIVLPTAENVRYFGTNKEERPVIGGQYNQYTLEYSIEKEGSMGIVAGAKSITTHVFYVLGSLAASFETELDKLGIVYGVDVTEATSGNLANAATRQLTAVNAVGTVVWSITSGTSATVSASGLVTAHATTDGGTVVRATDAIGNYGEITITVA